MLGLHNIRTSDHGRGAPRSIRVHTLPAPPRRGWLYFPLIALGIATFMAEASSAQDQIRTTTYDGIPLDEPIQIRFGRGLLRIPAGYLAPWPKLGARNRVNEASRLAFNFWMPSRRYLEIHDS